MVSSHGSARLNRSVSNDSNHAEPHRLDMPWQPNFFTGSYDLIRTRYCPGPDYYNLSSLDNCRQECLHLFGGANQDFVDADVFGLGDSKDNGDSDILTS